MFENSQSGMDVWSYRLVILICVAGGGVCQYLNLIDRNYGGCGPLHLKEAERRGELCAATEVLVGVALFFFD